MPTVLRQDGFAVRIYTDDHEPMHVHVIKAESEVVINLGDRQTAPWVRDNHGMSKRDERRALAIVGANRELLTAEWRRIHG
jgi:Domain of unknown function (DUF4160)